MEQLGIWVDALAPFALPIYLGVSVVTGALFVIAAGMAGSAVRALRDARAARGEAQKLLDRAERMYVSMNGAAPGDLTFQAKPTVKDAIEMRPVRRPASERKRSSTSSRKVA
ncbi:MAG: hypothetical protein AAGC95_04640 [Pseudomonadota bacterium]